MTLRRRAAKTSRTGTPAALVVVGLANPGDEYVDSRHNVGGDAVRALAAAHHIALKVEPRQRAALGTVTTPLGLIMLAVPTTYMNESGAAVPGLLARGGVTDSAQVLVVHDELDLEPGRLQLKRGGGLAGHNGLRSIASVLGTQDFLRLRIGVGKAPHKDAGADWVLQRLKGAARAARLEDVARAADALALVVAEGFDQAVPRVNGSRS